MWEVVSLYWQLLNYSIEMCESLEGHGWATSVYEILHKLLMRDIVHMYI